LEKLEINLEHYEDKIWDQLRLFRTVKFDLKKLPRVHTLHMKPYNLYLWNMCPNVILLSTTGFGRLPELPAAFIPTAYDERMTGAVGDFTKLRHLRIDAMGEWELLSCK
jgi:hypothetical protein